MFTTSSRSRAVSVGSFLVLAFCQATYLRGQTITTTSDGNLGAVLALGSLIPGKTSTVTPGTVQFRIRNSHDTGYHVTATATVTVNNTGVTSGGDALSASDVGIGIASVVPAQNAIVPRTDVITAGFNYDPTTVSAVDGLTPYTGAAAGMATLSDLAVGRTILRGSKIFANTNIRNPFNWVTVTMKIGVLPQYFTPCSFSAVVTLTISNGP